MKLLEISQVLININTAVFIAELFKMPVVLLHVTGLVKETPCKMTEEKTIKNYAFNKHTLVMHPTTSLCGLHVNI